MIFKFLFGDGLIRWLEKLGQGYDARRAAVAEGAAQSVDSPTAPYQPSDETSPLEFAYPRVSRDAMGSEFEIYLAGTDRDSLIYAANAALEEIERLDRQLSHYKDDSDVARLNSNASGQWVRLEPRMYRLLQRCRELSAESEGAFDITTGPLTKAWGFYKGEGRTPADEELAEIMQRVGMDRILFDEDDHLVYYSSPGLEIDFGAIGKGYAIDEAANTLHFHGVQSALIHGGQSTIYAMGASPETDGAGWELTIKDPRDHETPIQTVVLRDEALSTSGNYEQFFEVDGVRYSHILDPRTGQPVQGMVSVSVIAPNAADSDALSTAFFVMGREKTEEYCRAHPNLKVVMMEACPDGELEVTRIGFDVPDSVIQ